MADCAPTGSLDVFIWESIKLPKGNEEVAKNNPKKIITTYINLENKISDEDCMKIIEIFKPNQIKIE